MTTDELGRIIRAERRAQGLRQDQLAGAAGVGVRFLSELERGKATARVGKALGVPPARKYASDGGPGFVRCFDLVRRVCARPVAYPHLTATLAMKIGRRGTLHELRPGAWDRFGERADRLARTTQPKAPTP